LTGTPSRSAISFASRRRSVTPQNPGFRRRSRLPPLRRPVEHTLVPVRPLLSPLADHPKNLLECPPVASLLARAVAYADLLTSLVLAPAKLAAPENTARLA